MTAPGPDTPNPAGDDLTRHRRRFEISPVVPTWTWRARHDTPDGGVGPVMDVERRLHLEDGMPQPTQPTHNPGGWTHTEPPLPWEPEASP